MNSSFKMCLKYFWLFDYLMFYWKLCLIQATQPIIFCQQQFKMCIVQILFQEPNSRREFIKHFMSNKIKFLSVQFCQCLSNIFEIFSVLRGCVYFPRQREAIPRVEKIVKCWMKVLFCLLACLNRKAFLRFCFSITFVWNGDLCKSSLWTQKILFMNAFRHCMHRYKVYLLLNHLSSFLRLQYEIEIPKIYHQYLLHY